MLQPQTTLPCSTLPNSCFFVPRCDLLADLWVLCSWLWYASANRAGRMPKVTAAAVYSYHTTAYAQLATAAHALLMQLCCSSFHCTSSKSLILNTTYRARFVSVGEKMTPSDFERHAGRGAKISTNLHSQCCRHVTKSYPIGMATY